MVFLAFLLVFGFAVSAILYGNSLNKIRVYLKTNHPKQFDKYNLDAASLFLGTDDVEWNFQKFVHNRKFLELRDHNLNKLCEQTMKYGLLTLGCGIGMLVAVVVNGIVGS